MLHENFQEDMQSSPLISVVMPAYNAEAHLLEALQSVLNQTYANFELILIDDGSTDGTLEIARSLSDSRIRIVVNESNMGLVDTLNKALGLCRGDYIARMDSDDICVPERFALQLAFLQRNPDVGVVGGAIRFFGKIPNENTFQFPVLHEDIRVAMLFYCPLAHPALMFRRAVYDQGYLQYSKEFLHAEDYFLWSQLTQKVRSANVPELVLHYRLHPKQVSSSESNRQYLVSLSVRKRMLEEAGIQYDNTGIDLHESVILERAIADIAYLNALAQWFKKLEEGNRTSRYWDPAALNALLTIKFRESVTRSGVLSYWSQASEAGRSYLPSPEASDIFVQLKSRGITMLRQGKRLVRRMLATGGWK